MSKEEYFVKTRLATLRALARRMFQVFPAHEVYETVHEALAEASDDYWFERKYPQEEFIKKFVEPQQREIKRMQERKVNHKDSLSKKIAAKLSIIGIADEYGLRPLRKNKRVCPFHNDKDPSLSLNDDEGLFNCFGCGAKGNIIMFVYLLRKHKINGVEHGKN